MKNVVIGILLFVVGSVGAVGFYVLLHRVPQELVSPIGEGDVANDSQNLFSIDEAPTNSLRGSVTAFTNGWWEDRTATEPAKLTANVQLQQGETIIASDSGTLTATFPTIVDLSLSAETEVEIAQTLPVNLVFNQKKGDVVFNVAGTSPVSVRTLRLLTNISQAAVIQISVDEETHTITVTVKSGLAQLAYNDPNLTSQVLDVQAGRTFTFNSDNRVGRIR